MINVKAGVVFKRFTTPIMEALPRIDAVFRRHGKTATITSAADGKHSKNSLHPKHLALDLRTHGIAAETVEAILEDLQNVLGPDWDCLWECRGKPNSHLHLEYDPR